MREEEVLWPLSTLVLSFAKGEAGSDASLGKHLLSLIDHARSDDGRHELALLKAVSFLLPLTPFFLSRLYGILSPLAPCQSIFSPAPPVSFDNDAEQFMQPSSASLPPSSDEFRPFILFIKLLRNLCAGDPVNQDAFLQLKGLNILVPIAQRLALDISNSQGCSDELEGKSISDVPNWNQDISMSLSPQNFSCSFPSFPLASKERSRRILLPDLIEALQMLLQLLGNVAGRGEASQAAIWEKFFPTLFGALAACPSEKIQGPVCMVIHTCSKGSKERCAQLSQADGSSLVASLLNSDGSLGSKSARNGWLELLVACMCLKEPHFPRLFTSLGVCPLKHELYKGQPMGTTVFTKEQALLLEILLTHLSEQEEAVSLKLQTSDHWRLMPEESVGFLVNIIGHAAQCAHSNSLIVPTFPTTSPVLNVLQLSLSIARIFCAWDDTGVSEKEMMDGWDEIVDKTEVSISTREDSVKRSSMATELAANGLILVLLDMLRALGPPESVKRMPSEHDIGQERSASTKLMITDSGNVNNMERDSRGNGSNIEGPQCSTATAEHHNTSKHQMPISSQDTSAESGANGILEQTDGNIQRAEGFPITDPYKGYRRDIVAVIANASHRRFSIQEEIRERGDLLLVLQQCMVDRHNPFLREWGLWAIRNLLEDNKRNQQELVDLEMRAAVDIPELTRMGLRVEMNSQTGRPRLVNDTAIPRP